jgi:hypothetical protein
MKYYPHWGNRVKTCKHNKTDKWHKCQNENPPLFINYLGFLRDCLAYQRTLDKSLILPIDDAISYSWSMYFFFAWYSIGNWKIGLYRTFVQGSIREKSVTIQDTMIDDVNNADPYVVGAPLHRYRCWIDTKIWTMTTHNGVWEKPTLMTIVWEIVQEIMKIYKK